MPDRFFDGRIPQNVFQIGDVAKGSTKPFGVKESDEPGRIIRMVKLVESRPCNELFVKSGNGSLAPFIAADTEAKLHP